MHFPGIIRSPGNTCSPLPPSYGPTCRLSLSKVLKQGLRDQAEMLVKSDADEQLLLSVAFSSKVKVHSIKIDAPEGASAPKTLKLFVNKASLDFSDVESMAPDQTFELAPEQIGQRLELKFVKFQNVDRLTLFFADNQGDVEVTALSGIRLWGAGLAVTNVRKHRFKLQAFTAIPRAPPTQLK